MINIFVYGLDQFVVGDLSERLTPILAKAFEADEDEINFIAPNDFVFHNGVEQTSWRVIVEVRLPAEFDIVEHEVKEVLLHYISQVSVHVEVTFIYYERRNHYVKINKDYPLYLEEKEGHLNEEEYEEEYDETDEEGPSEGEGEDEIYTEDIFKGRL
ncbi:MAG: hypothetical protein K5925_06245 [Bacilli bacterium]|nr:hypothetical protein [Bacilli bacterium]